MQLFICIIILENILPKSQLYDKLIKLLLPYHFCVTKRLFQLLAMEVFQDN